MTARALISLMSTAALAACLSSPSPQEPIDGGGNRIDAGDIDGAGGEVDAADVDAAATTNTGSVHVAAVQEHYLSAADQPDGVDVDTAITLEAWIKLDTLPAMGERYAVIVKANVAAVDNSYGLEIKNEGGVYRVEARVEGTRGGSNGWDSVGWNWGSLGTGTWYHVAFTYDRAGDDVAAKFRHYRDGTEIQGGLILFDTDIDTIRNSGAPMVIGARVTGSAGSNFFDGSIDEVRVWNRVRSGAEIAADRDRELVGDETGLLGYWQLDDALVDSTGRGNTLTATGVPGPAFVPDTPF